MYLSRFPNVIEANQHRFKPLPDCVSQENELPDAMIASAATAVSTLQCAGSSIDSFLPP
jgi:hypothetical protein